MSTNVTHSKGNEILISSEYCLHLNTEIAGNPTYVVAKDIQKFVLQLHCLAT